MSKILISEDSLIVNQHISKTLEIAGHEVFSAYTGKEAIELASRELPDLILMDIMMETNDDGILASIEIKRTLGIPIIFLTALTDDRTLERVKNSEPYGYIVKPFNEVELLSNITVALHKSKVENEVKNSRDLFQSSINSIDQGFFLIDENEEIFYLNNAAEGILEKSFKELIGQSIDLVFSIKDEAGSITVYNQLEETIKSDPKVIFILTKDSGEVPIGDLSLETVHLKEKTYSILLFRDITDRLKARKLENELEHRRIASLIEGQENERNRLSREIHDGIGQMINLIKVKTKSLPESPAKNELISILEQTLEEVRNVSENLHPSRLKDFSLEKNIDHLIRQYDKIGKIQFDFSHSDVPDLDQFAKTHLYRIVQEALSNIIKHSKAKEATIQLIGLNNSIQLTIEDDGVGYDPSKISSADSHHGLENIEHRVNSLNGKLTIDSNNQNGTMVLINIPL